jgi:hypothetical protein
MHDAPFGRCCECDKPIGAACAEEAGKKWCSLCVEAEKLAELQQDIDRIALRSASQRRRAEIKRR